MKNLSINLWVRPNSNEKKKLTHHVAKTATSTYRTKWIRDIQVPGFALRIEKTGKKSWTFGYRHLDLHHYVYVVNHHRSEPMVTDSPRRNGTPSPLLPGCPGFRPRQERDPDFQQNHRHLDLRDIDNATNFHSLDKTTALLSMMMTG